MKFPQQSTELGPNQEETLENPNLRNPHPNDSSIIFENVKAMEVRHDSGRTVNVRSLNSSCNMSVHLALLKCNIKQVSQLDAVGSQQLTENVGSGIDRRIDRRNR